MNFISYKQLTKKKDHMQMLIKSFNLFEVIGFLTQRCMLSKTICAKNLRKLIQTDKIDTNRDDGLMKTKLFNYTTMFPLVETIKLEVK